MQDDAYIVHARLGSGTTGAVFRVTRRSDGRQRALKALHADVAEGIDLDHLRQVIADLRALQHHAIAADPDLFTWRGDQVLGREYVRGVDLATVVAGSATPARPALQIAAEIAGALAVVRARTGHTHGDVKPSNVFVTIDGDVKLVDFGLSRAHPEHVDRTLTMFHGSVGFMSPERADNQDNPAGDVYSLGLLLAWMLTGEMPQRTSPNPKRHDERRAALLARLTRADVSPDVVALIAECTWYDAPKRPAIGAVARQLAELTEAAAGPPVAAWAGPLVEALIVQPTEVEITDTGQSLSATIAPAASASPVRPVSRTTPVSSITTGAHALPPRSKRRVPPWAWALIGVGLLMLAVAMLAGALAIATSG